MESELQDKTFFASFDENVKDRFKKTEKAIEKAVMYMDKEISVAKIAMN